MSCVAQATCKLNQQGASNIQGLSLYYHAIVSEWMQQEKLHDACQTLFAQGHLADC